MHHIMSRPKNLDKINKDSDHCIRSGLLHTDWLAFRAVALQITNYTQLKDTKTLENNFPTDKSCT